MEAGLKHTSTITVEEKHLACNVGSGDLRVLGTPMMTALMENAAMMAVKGELEDGQTTVGGFLSSSHLKPTGVGHTVTATAELVAVEGRKLKFKVSASDEDGLIGEGEHLRFIVDREKFMGKVEAKTAAPTDSSKGGEPLPTAEDTVIPPSGGTGEGLKWKTLSSEYIIKRPWLTARKDTLEMPNGRIVPEFYVLEYPTWLNVIAITEDGLFVMVEQYRHGLDIVEFELCAGVMEDSDESVLAAAQRELLEETGFGGGEWEEFMAISANPTSMNNLSHTFIARNVKPVTTQHLDDFEDIRVRLFTRDELLGLLQRGEIMQSLMVAPLWRFFTEER